jgi:hypothetical protein
MRLRRARSLHETNVDHFGARSFDLAVSTHNYPSERGIEKLIATSLAILRSRKSHQCWESCDPALNPAKDFDFAFPSLEGERSDRRAQSGTLLIKARLQRKPQKFPQPAYLYLYLSGSSKDDFMPGSRSSPVLSACSRNGNPTRLRQAETAQNRGRDEMDKTMIDIKQLTQQKNELKEVWDYLGIDSAFPDKQVRQWLIDFGKDEIEAAFMVLSKREHDVNDAVSYVGKVLHNSKLQNMTVEEREAKVSALRSLAGAIGARKKHEVELKAVRQGFAKDLPEVSQSFARTLPEFASEVGVGVGSGVGVDDVSETQAVAQQPRPAAATPPVREPSPRREEKTNTQTQTKTNGSGASGLSPNKRQDKPKTIKTARGEKPKPDGFDSWTNVQRTEWVACTCEFYEWGGDHSNDCAVKPETKAAAANQPQNPGTRIAEPFRRPCKKCGAPLERDKGHVCEAKAAAAGVRAIPDPGTDEIIETSYGKMESL